MKTLIVYESQFGNTHNIAAFIGREIESSGPVRLLTIHQFRASDLEGVDLFLVGGPTQAHTMTQAMKEFLGGLESRPQGILAAGFDTRIDLPKLLTGAAAGPITRGLKAAGFKVLIDGESFLVAGKHPSLVASEEGHAKEWAAQLMALAEAQLRVAV
jgi:hypothetical protein